MSRIGLVKKNKLLLFSKPYDAQTDDVSLASEPIERLSIEQRLRKCLPRCLISAIVTNPKSKIGRFKKIFELKKFILLIMIF